MVSVIIPSYNRSAYLKEAVESALAQKDVSSEVIVVDDGSTDNTDSVIQSFGSRIRSVVQVHAGVSAARNRGIREARGKWLAFLDSDDLWMPRKLAVQLDYLSRNPGLEICQTEEIWVRKGCRANPKKYHQKPEGFCFARLLDRCLVSPSAVLMHRNIFRAVGLFDEMLPACEDYDMWLRIGCRYPIGLVKEPLIIKRGGHPDQLSATVPALDRYRIHSMLKLIGTASLNGEQRDLVLQALQSKCRVFGEGCRKRGRIEEADMILSLPHRAACYLSQASEKGDCVSLHLNDLLFGLMFMDLSL